MSAVRKKIPIKSFRLFDFRVYDDKNEKTDKLEFQIQMFGINERGETCSITVNDHKPFFYIMVPNTWSTTDNILFRRFLKEKTKWDTVEDIEIVEHKKLYGFTGGKKHKFVKLTFQCSIAMNKVRRLWYSSGTMVPIKFQGKPLDIYESSIPPLLRYFHIQNVSPSGWVQLQKSKLKQPSTKETTCDYEYVCSKSAIVPLPDKETRVPYKICSFDIEASSSHGDFPVPIKSYKRLAIQIYDAYNSHKPDAKRLNLFLQRCILTAFEYDKFNGIDEVFPTRKCDKKDIQGRIAKFLKTSIHDAEALNQDAQSIIQVMKSFERAGDDDSDDEYSHKKKDKKENAATIIDVLCSETYSRDEKITHLDILMTSLFPKLEGDKVTFIGSTFMHYGEKEPYFNHCLVVDSCDDVPNATIESCPNEETLLIKWMELIQNENPDIIIGYNIFGFDYEFMFRRAQELQCDREFLQLSRKTDDICARLKDCKFEIENTKVVLASGEYDLKYYNMTGRLQIDLYTYFRRDFNLSSYKLDDVAGEFISDDIVKTNLTYDENDNPVTELYSKNVMGLHAGDYIHIELCGFTTDHYNDGAKFVVLKLEKREEDEKSWNVLTIHDHHDFDKKIKWTMAKDDVTPQDIFRLTRGSSADRAKVAKYCIQDCNLVHHLMNKIDVLTGYIEMSSICSVPMSFLVFRGQGIKLTSYVAKKCMEKDTLMPDLDKKGENEGYEGAIVLPPKCDMYMDRPVACVDYSSLYPSSMISQNYSHDSKVWTKEYDLAGNLVKETGETDASGNYIYDNLPEYQYIDIEFDTFRYVRKSANSKEEKVKSGKKICRWAQLPDNEKSIMPAILQELLKARSSTKKLMKKETDPFMQNILDKRQLGYKVTANSLYGQCGARTSTFYEKDVAASTTATGRMMIMYAKGMIEEIYGNAECNTEKYGPVTTKAEYVYGDTDSVFFTFNLEDPKTKEPIRGKKALEITIEIAQEAAQICTDWLKPPMSLEYEKTLMPFILLSKKRYVGMLYEDDPNKGNLKYMGLSLKRRDSCDYLKDTYGEILNILMKENDVEKSIQYLNKCLEDLVNGNVHMDKLAITRALRSEYKNPQQIAHRVLSDRIGQRDPGNKPKPGDRIKYVFIDSNKPKALLGERVETPQFIIDNKLKIDYTYYVTNQLMKPLQQLYGLALVPIWKHRNKNGAVKEYMKDITQMENSYGDDYEDYMKRKEKYCSAKVKIVLFDDILNKISRNRNNMQSIKSFFR